MSIINATLKVATLYECDCLQELDATVINTIYDTTWRQSVIGCHILDILRDMYQFNVSYVYNDYERYLLAADSKTTYIHNDSIDVYIRPMSLTRELSDSVYPVQSINTWRFGFLLRRPDTQHLYSFYSKPFAKPVWNCLFFMALFVSIIFYLLKRCECVIRGGSECSFPYELLMVIGAYCQHIPPIDPKQASRRIAYLIFFVFAYIVYAYYTSNLLSNLVNEKDHGLDLENLSQSDYECVLVDYMVLPISLNVNHHFNRNYSFILSRLLELRSMSVPAGLEAVRTEKVALLSDYTTIYPYIKRHFDTEDICKLITIDLFSNVKKYFFTSANFQYKEQFKIGTLRIKEAGILSRLVSSDYDDLQCTSAHHVQTSMGQISAPLCMLMTAYIASVLILMVERIHYKDTKVWPYVE